MRKRFAVLAAALALVVGLAPVASAGPWSKVCQKVTDVYESTGKDAPWECLQ